MGTRTRISIGVDKVCFNRTELEIDDSTNMSYVFENDARRILTLRWIGMDEETRLPIWEFTVDNVNDGFWVIKPGDFIVRGYGEYVHEGNTLTQVPATSPPLQVAA